jgi:hypothetical protein
MKDQFQARMLRIHFGEGDKWQGKPLHEAIVAKCMELGMAVRPCIEGSKDTEPAPEFTMPVIGRFPRTHRSC